MTKKTKAKRKSVSKKKADLVPDPSKAGDVADQAKLIEALRESEALYRSIFELSPDGIITVDLKGVITKCNPAFLKSSGYLEKDIIGKHFTKIPTLQAKDISLYKKMVASLVRGKIPEPFESEWINIDGTIHNGSIRPNLLKKDGKVVGFHVVVQDITERKRAEEALRETQTMYQSLVETSQDLIWRADRDGRFIYLNKAWEDTHGYKIEEMLGKPFSDFQPPEIAERDIQEFGRHLAGGRVRGYETIHISKSGKAIDMIFNAIPLFDDKGDIIGTQGTAIYIYRPAKASTLFEGFAFNSENGVRDECRIKMVPPFSTDRFCVEQSLIISYKSPMIPGF